MLNAEVKKLTRLLEDMPNIGMQSLVVSGAPIYMLDFIIVAAIQRTLSLGRGLLSMVDTKNMLCGRAIVRMQIDTVSRLLAYTYVDDPEEMAKKVIGGKQLKRFKSRDGCPLCDKYLVDRMSQEHEWVRRVYNTTNEEVHFSRRQFFSTIDSLNNDKDELAFSQIIRNLDSHYPESSWYEIVACFIALYEILMPICIEYGEHKKRNSQSLYLNP